MRKKVEDDLSGRMADAEKTIAAKKQAALANVRAIAQDAAGMIVERLIGSPPSAAAVDAAVSEALKRNP